MIASKLPTLDLVDPTGDRWTLSPPRWPNEPMDAVLDTSPDSDGDDGVVYVSRDDAVKVVAWLTEFFDLGSTA